MASLEPQPSAREDWNGESKNCIDGSRITFCLLEGRQAQSMGRAPWISARFANTSVHSVVLTIFAPWGGLKFAPFEVWLGGAFGDQKTRCSLAHGGTKEPSHGGAPTIADCLGATHDHVTLLQVRHACRPPPSTNAQR